MSKKKTHEEFIKELKTINNNIEVISIYAGCDSDIKCRCLIDKYEWTTKPKYLLQGKGCRKCAIEKFRVAKKHTENDFKNKLQQVNNNVKLISKYIDSHSQITVKCKKCDYEWNTLPGSLLYKKTQCPQCIGEAITPQYYKKIVYDLVGNEYDVISDYVDANTKIKYKHNLCGYEFSMKPSSFKKVVRNAEILCVRENILLELIDLSLLKNFIIYILMNMN